jgi:y4mF family transcriptional regulator
MASADQPIQIHTPLDLGQIVRQARKRAQLTQEDLALASNTSVSFIVDLEKGKPTVHIGKALAAAAAAGVSLTARESA